MQSLLRTLVMIAAVGGGDDASVRGSLWRRRVVLALCPGRLPAAAVVLGEPLPAAPLGIVKLGEHMKPWPMKQTNQDKLDSGIISMNFRYIYTCVYMTCAYVHAYAYEYVYTYDPLQ